MVGGKSDTVKQFLLVLISEFELKRSVGNFEASLIL